MNTQQMSIFDTFGMPPAEPSEQLGEQIGNDSTTTITMAPQENLTTPSIAIGLNGKPLPKKNGRGGKHRPSTTTQQTKPATTPPAPPKLVKEAPLAFQLATLRAFLSALQEEAEQMCAQMNDLAVELGNPMGELPVINADDLRHDAQALLRNPAFKTAIGICALDLFVQNGGTIEVVDAPPPPPPPPAPALPAQPRPSNPLTSAASTTTATTTNIHHSHPWNATEAPSTKANHKPNAWYQKKDRHDPIVRRGFIIKSHKNPFSVPEIEYVDIAYGTATTVRTANRSVQNHDVYCIPTQQDEHEFTQSMNVLSSRLEAFNAHLNAMGEYQTHLTKRGGASKVKAPLTKTVVVCDGTGKTWGWTPWKIPAIPRHTVKRHTEKMIEFNDSRSLQSLNGVHCCVNDETYHQLQQLRTACEEARKIVFDHLIRLGTYEQALADNRHGKITIGDAYAMPLFAQIATEPDQDNEPMATSAMGLDAMNLNQWWTDALQKPPSMKAIDAEIAQCAKHMNELAGNAFNGQLPEDIQARYNQQISILNNLRPFTGTTISTSIANWLTGPDRDSIPEGLSDTDIDYALALTAINNNPIEEFRNRVNAMQARMTI